jgi:hypothetical protein
MAEALVGNWDQAEAQASIYGRDPFGYGPLILTAAALRRDDEAPLIFWAKLGGPSGQTQLREMAEQLILQVEKQTAQ